MDPVLMTTEFKPPFLWQIGDVVAVTEMAELDRTKARFPSGSCCHQAWPVDWYAVLTKPGREMAVDVRLRDQGYDSFLPKRLVEIRLPGKKRRVSTVQRPLYPRYVFAGVPVGRLELGPVYNTRGVSTVLSDGGGAMRMRPEIIGDLMLRGGSSGIIEITEVPAGHLFSEGMEVEFRSESLWAPFRGTIVRVDSNGMVKVNIDSSSRAWPVRVHYSELLPPETG